MPFSLPIIRFARGGVPLIRRFVGDGAHNREFGGAGEIDTSCPAKYTVSVEVTLTDAVPRLSFGRAPYHRGREVRALNAFVENVAAGITGGIIATFVLYIIKHQWFSVVMPWHENQVHKGVRIEGEWRSRYVIDGVVRESIWRVKRQGHRITAETTRVSGPNIGKGYSYSGLFMDRVLTATYHSCDARALDRGSISLVLVGNGERMKGWITYFSFDDNTVRACEYELVRHDSVQAIQEAPSTDDPGGAPPSAGS